MITMTGNGFSLATYSKNSGSVILGTVTIGAGELEKALRAELDAGQIEKLKK